MGTKQVEVFADWNKTVYLKTTLLILDWKSFDCSKQWGWYEITLDNNVLDNDDMQAILKNHFVHNNLLWDSEYFHICCSAHILNLIIQGCLKVVDVSLYKIGIMFHSIKLESYYVTGSTGRTLKFKDSIKDGGWY